MAASRVNSLPTAILNVGRRPLQCPKVFSESEMVISARRRMKYYWYGRHSLVLTRLFPHEGGIRETIHLGGRFAD